VRQQAGKKPAVPLLLVYRPPAPRLEIGPEEEHIQGLQSLLDVMPELDAGQKLKLQIP